MSKRHDLSRLGEATKVGDTVRIVDGRIVLKMYGVEWVWLDGNWKLLCELKEANP